MTSTTGAHGDYPDYYYKLGNLFGSYLLGSSAPMSWDTRKKLECSAGVIRSSAHSGQVRRPPPFLERRTMSWWATFRAHVSPAGARRVLTLLAAARGVELGGREDADPYGALDDFVLKHLTLRAAACGAWTPSAGRGRSGCSGAALLEKGSRIAAGYSLTSGVLAADALGWPQTRKRFFLVARRSGRPEPLADIALELRREPQPVSWAIGDLLDRGGDLMDEVAELSAENAERVAWLFFER